MTIRNYWECILPDGENTPPLQRIVGESTTLARQHFSSWQFDANGEDLKGAEFACMGFATSDIRAIVHLVKLRGRPSFYLHSAFPWLAAGAPVRLTLYDADTDHFGLEGFVNAGIDGGPSVTFFDPLYALKKGAYKIGSEHNFYLGALSLDLRLAASEPDTSQAKILARAADDASDYYFFRGAVRSIRNTDFLDRPFLVFRTAVVGLDGDDLAVDIYVDRARFQKRAVPAAGDMVSGRLWLQGCLAEREGFEPSVEL
ncbi:MAG: hypothetical protein WD696_14120 [Bryobacteraceae bacterium]